MKTSIKQQALDSIRSALDCHTHFTEPTIVSNDADFIYGKRSMVVCEQCVKRFEEILDASKIGHYPFASIRAIVKEKFHMIEIKLGEELGKELLKYWLDTLNPGLDDSCILIEMLLKRIETFHDSRKS